MSPAAPATVHHTTRAGIPTLWVERDGAVRATLVFRVGILDEPFALGGLTHLVEHLALTSLGSPTYAINGHVANDHTAFMVRGSVEEAEAFLTHVAGALADLPTDRLRVERSVLEAERGSSPGIDTVPYLAHLRWGVRGPGRRGLPELGLRTVDGADVRAWARERFTSAAATLCWVGPEPPTMPWRLLDGAAPASPPTPHPVVPLPLAAHGDDGVVALGAAVPATIASAILAELLERRTTQVLRHERGIVYAVESSLNGVTADLAHLAVLVEVDGPGRASEVQAVLVDQLDRLARGEVDESDLDASRRRLTEDIHDPDWMAAHLLEMAVRQQAGRPARDIAEEVGAANATNAQVISGLADDVLDSAVLLAPESAALPRWGKLDEVPQPPPVRGERFTTGGLRRKRRQTLTLGDEGFSLTVGHEPTTTAYWDEIVAVTRERGGEYSLTNVGGAVWLLDPNSFKGGPEPLVQLLEARIDAATVVPAPGAEHFDALDQAAARDLKKPAKLQLPLGELPCLLEPGEAVIQLASVLTKMRWGVLAVTDRRSLFVAHNGTGFDLEDTSHSLLARVRIDDSLKGKSLVLVTAADEYSYWGFDRQAEAKELRAHLERLLDEA